MQLSDFAEWAAGIVGPDYVSCIGPWIDTPALQDKFILSISGSGGAAPVVDVRYPRVRVVLLGPRNGQAHKLRVLTDADALIVAAIERVIMPCGAANIRALGEPQGPALTTENRPWVGLSFEAIF